MLEINIPNALIFFSKHSIYYKSVSIFVDNKNRKISVSDFLNFIFKMNYLCNIKNNCNFVFILFVKSYYVEAFGINISIKEILWI